MALTDESWINDIHKKLYQIVRNNACCLVIRQKDYNFIGIK